MIIVINAFSARVGGGKTYLNNLLSNLPEDTDLDIRLFAPGDLTFIPDARIRRQSNRWLVNHPLLRTIWEWSMLPFYLRNIKADLLFCPGGILITKPPKGCKSATMFRNMLPFDSAQISSMGFARRLRVAILKRLMLRSFARADLTIFISDYARSLIERIISTKQALTISHGVADRFRNVRPGDEPISKPFEGEYLLYVSRLEHYKHHVEVIKAYADLPTEIRQQYKLALVGEDYTPEAQIVRDTIERLQLQSQVSVVGGVPYDALPAWYHNTKLNIFASSCENCPNILLEALAAGRPVLCSDVMPMPEFGGPDLSYFDPTIPSSLTKAIMAVLSNPDEETAASQAAVVASERYDWRKTARQTWHALQNLADSH